MSHMHDVIVIGCGASGIAALNRLDEAGLNTLGLEAANRIGGRIYTVPFGKNVVDLGAQWCHGEKDNVIYELVKDLDVLNRPDPFHNCFILSNGELLDIDDVSDVLKHFQDLIDKANKNNDLSISEFLEKSYHKLIASVLESGDDDGERVVEVMDGVDFSERYTF